MENSKKTKKKMQKKQNSMAKGFMWRCFVLLFIFIAFVVAIVWKLKVLQINEGGDWQARADRQQLRSATILPERGTIFDSKGRVLAQSTAVWTVEAAPDVLAQSSLNKDKTLDKNVARVASNVLAPILGFSESEKENLYEKLSEEEKRYYKVKGQVDRETAEAIKAACSEYNIKGIYLTDDTKRLYPYQELAANVLGFVGDAGEGREGLEFYYNELLTGTNGRQILAVNAYGNEMPSDEDYPYYAAEDGNSIVLTIDVDIQQVLEKHIKQEYENNNATSRAMGMVMDVDTGAILGMAIYPAFNPNDPFEIFDENQQFILDSIRDSKEYTETQSAMRSEQWRNKILSDTYEPGSIVKIITAAAAYDSGIYSNNDIFYCSGGIMVDGWDDPIRCALAQVHGQLNINGALVKSCNEAFVRIGLGLGATRWYDYANAFGLTEPTGVDLPGEPSQASLNAVTYRLKNMKTIDLAVCSFGQGNKYTAMQMMCAVSAAVNGGRLMQPYVVQQVLDSNGNVIEETQPIMKRQAVSEYTSSLLRAAMEEMVETTNSGNIAYLTGYHVGGKSGTSQKLELQSKEEREEYIASFFGFAPANDPKVAVLVIIDEPQADDLTGVLGGRVAAPAVRNILKDVLPILGVEPDYNSNPELARSTVNVPQLIGLELNTAQVRLCTNGMTYEVVGSGKEISGQYPETRSELNYGGVVYLYTDPESGFEVAEVPSVVGKSPNSAIMQLKNAGFNVLTSGAPDASSSAVVAEQNISAGTTAPKGTLIRLEVTE